MNENIVLKIIAIVAPLAGVVIGAALAPFFENRKRKWEIKSELFQMIFLYYNAKKCYLHKANYQWFHDHRRSLVAKILKSGDGGEQARPELLRQHDVCKGWADEHHRQAWHWYTEMINFDGKISLLLTQSPHYFKHSRKRDLRSDLEKHLYSVKITSVFDYDNMDDKQLDKIYPKIESHLSKKYLEINKAREKAIEVLKNALG